MANFTGKKIVCTGTMLATRAVMYSYIKSLGAIPSNSMDMSVDILIVGNKPGESKLSYAYKKNISTISEKEFYALAYKPPTFVEYELKTELKDFKDLLPDDYNENFFNRGLSKFITSSNITKNIVVNKPKNFLKFEM